MSEYNIQMNKYNALNAGYDQLYPQPMKHANTHAEDGNDPITPSMIGTYNKTEIDTALQNKAPAGYGLGGNAKLLTSADNLDNIKENGWYWWYDTRPSGAEFNYCHMRVDNGEAGTLSSVTQTIYRNDMNSVMIRFYNGDTWITEYANPPMALGIEYRTTERYLGKPVYVKAIDFGEMPNASTKVVNHGIANIDQCISATGTTTEASGATSTIPYTGIESATGINNACSFSRSWVRVWASRDNSMNRARITIKYTKTTD